LNKTILGAAEGKAGLTDVGGVAVKKLNPAAFEAFDLNLSVED
jgi:hypothetical protein